MTLYCLRLKVPRASAVPFAQRLEAMIAGGGNERTPCGQRSAPRSAPLMSANRLFVLVFPRYNIRISCGPC